MKWRHSVASELERLYALRAASERMGDGYRARLEEINRQIAKLEALPDNGAADTTQHGQGMETDQR